MSLNYRITLDSSVRLVMLQFRFNNFEAIPQHTRYLIREADEKRVEHASSGTMTIEPTKRCSLEHLPFVLERAGYDLVDARGEERTNKNDRTGKSTHFMVRFMYIRRQFARKSDGLFGKIVEQVRQELIMMCQNALWRSRAYLNPYFENDEAVADQHAVSINMEVREPFLRPDGQLVTEWKKDAEGERVGEYPLLLKAQHTFVIEGDAITLV